MNLQPTFSAQELSAYVKALGWIQVEKALQDGFYLFNHPQFASRQLLFGMDESFDDYDEALENTAQKLAQIYEWSLSEAVRRIEESNHEVIVALVPDENRHVSTVSLIYASQVLEAQKDMWLAGAAANGQRRAFYPSPKHGDNKKLLEAARFRHTEESSFIFKASCRLYAIEGEGNIPMFSQEEAPPPMPFVRRAMLNIGEGLQELVRSIETRQTDKLVDEIKENPQSPVSANLCQAVAELSDKEHPHAVELSFGWSPLLTPPPEAPRQFIRIPADDFPVIAEIGKALEPRKKPKRATYIGTVEELRGSFNKLGQREGQVLLSLIGEKNERTKVRVTLEASQYDEAVAVHTTTATVVRVTGTIKPSQRQPYNFDLDKFEIINV